MSDEEKCRDQTSDREEVIPIRLQPSSSDYITFVETTIRAMNITGPLKHKSKPNKLLLSLAKKMP